MRLKGVVDASALHPAALRDLVLGLAQGEFFDIRWSPTTIDEMRDRIRHSKPYLAVRRLDAIANSMREAFPEADVFYEDDETARKLTSDERYRHVVAAAFFDAAHFVVTAKRDFQCTFVVLSASQYGLLTDWRVSAFVRTPNSCFKSLLSKQLD